MPESLPLSLRLGSRGHVLVMNPDPRPTPLTLRGVVEHATKELEGSGPAGNELARRLAEYALDPALGFRIHNQ